MAIRLKPKTFGPVYVIFDGTDGIQYAMGEPDPAGPYPPATTPVDTMIAALGACIVKSVQIAAGKDKSALQPFTLRLTGAKSTDLPGRIAQIEADVIGDVVADAGQEAALLQQAKSICTVSNTMTAKVTLRKL